MSSLEIKDGALVITSGGQQLTLREQPENGTMNIAVEGDITSEAALCFSDELLAAVTVSNGIVLDLSGRWIHLQRRIQGAFEHSEGGGRDKGALPEPAWDLAGADEFV